MAICGLAAAADIYRWVDEQGRVQMSDRPPPKASGQVIKQDARPGDVTPEQRKAAQDRAAREQELLKSAEEERNKQPPPQSPKPRAAASNGFADESDPSLPPRASAEDCRMWRAEYYRSKACFAPFRNGRGRGIKAEAFAICGPELVDPEFECKYRK
jgi:hypothetical protein